MERVDGSVISPGQLLVVARDHVRTTPEVADEGVGHHEDALVGEIARVLVHGCVFGRQVLHQQRLGVTDRAHRFVYQGFCWMQHLPHRGRARARIECQEFRQDRGAGARHADHEGGREQFGCENFRTALPQFAEPQTVPQAAQQVVAREQPAHEVK